MALSQFHKSIADWFNKNLGEPTLVQQEAWPAIKNNKYTLIAAPTGSGKTLAAFLVAIDNLVKQNINGTLQQETQVVYISPLKALSNDIERNLQVPLKEVRKNLKQESIELQIEVAVRTGDTTQHARTAMFRKPPHIVVTTPESLYILLTSDSGRRLLSTVKTIIVDEIHALVGDKRGSHLSLSLERLENLAQSSLSRIGISATQKPIDEVARFLVGNRYKEDIYSTCKIIDTGHKRKLDISMEIPHTPLSTLMPHEVWDEIYKRLIGLINEHETTLIFVNTRRLAERLAHNLTKQIGEEHVMAHHGSMSKEKRLKAEQSLKHGQLKVLVATASLELGIDIGSVDLVCQISSPHGIASLLQRVGRSSHQVRGIPKGRIFPLTRDDLIECTALLDSIRRGELDRIIIPEKPLDVLSQQIVAEVACREYDVNELFTIFKFSYPFRNLTYEEFTEVLKTLSEGYSSKNGRRGAYIYYDMVHDKLRARKAAKLTALVSGGTIPDNFNYDVVLEPENTIIGTVDEDFAIESIPGNIFQLGNNSWRILKIENGRLRVEDAKGLPPNIPFWFGEAPGRSYELSDSVSRLIDTISEHIGNIKDHVEESLLEAKFTDTEWKDEAIYWLIHEVGITEPAADQVVTYLGIAKINLSNLPTLNRIIIERFFDEAGDMHMVIHSLFGSRFNKAWGLALRKRFCRKFNFELQAAANENSIILSLGATHSFPLQEVFHYLNPKTVRDVLIQAMFDAPLFEVRWRWNASIALAVVRRMAGKRVPAQFQRTQSEDLIAHVFPDQLACLENIAGDREIPEHPLVNQTIHDCLYDAMDIEKLEEILELIYQDKIEMISMDVTEPSPLAQEILVAQPYAFLDNVPIEERRVNAVMKRRWVEVEDAKNLGQLDTAAINKVKEEAWPQVENPDELYEALALGGFLTLHEVKNKEGSEAWFSFLNELMNENRATILKTQKDGVLLCIAIERLPEFKKIYPNATIEPEIEVPERIKKSIKIPKNPLVEIIRGRLEILGPVTVRSIAASMGLSRNEILQALLALENEGFVFRGKYSRGLPEDEWCERRLLARINRYTIETLRKSIEPVSKADFMRFLFRWQHVMPEEESNRQNLLPVILEQLAGFDAQAVSWEGDILPTRLGEYNYMWLDLLCMSGSYIWGRFNYMNNSKSNEKINSPIRTTPITFIERQNLDTFINQSEKNNSGGKFSSYANLVLQELDKNGALFFDQIRFNTKLLDTQVENALCELISHGVITSDSFTGLRALLIPDKYLNEKRRSKKMLFSLQQAGRWWKINPEQEQQDNHEETIERIAMMLLKRYGIVFRKLAEKEKLLPHWRDLLRFYRRMEARGEIRGGRFIDGFWGEQFALPEAVARLRSIRNEEKDGKFVVISASDPLNLTGVITPGKRIPSIYSNRIMYCNGVPVAVKEGKEIVYFEEYDEKQQWDITNKLIKKTIPPELRIYLSY